MKRYLASGGKLAAHARARLRSLADVRHRLGVRLLSSIMLFSACVTLILTLLQLYLEYRHDVSALDSRLDQISKSSLDSLAEGLWALDEQQLELQLTGILTLPDIRAVEVREIASAGDPLVIALGDKSASSPITREYPLRHNVQGQNIRIGTLHVQATLADIYRRLFDTALTLLVRQAAKTFFVSLFIVYIFHYLVTRHLFAIAAFADSYRINDPPPPLRLLRSPRRHDDELQRVVTAFNALSEHLQVAYRNLRHTNDQLTRDVAARREAEAVLREREARIRRLVDANIIGILIWDVGKILEANDAFLRMVGYDREDLAAGRVRRADLLPPEWRDRSTQDLAQLARTGTVQPYEKEYIRKDGSRVPVLVGIATFEDGSDQGVAFVLDLTERKRAEQALRERDAKIQRLVDANIIGVFVADLEGRIIEANDAFLRVVGREREDLTSGRMNVMDMTPPDWHDRTARTMADIKLRRTVQPYENEYFRKDGSRVPVLVGSAPFAESDAGIPLGVVFFVIELTELKRAEKALRESEEQWKAVFENNPTMYFMVDASGTIISVNCLGAEQLGYTVDELIGRPVQNLFHAEDRDAVDRNTACCFKRPGQSMSWEARKIRNNGEVLWVRETTRVMFIKDRPVALIVCENITERKRVGEALREVQVELAHANRVATIGQITASIAHEVNQPIAAAVTNAHAALRWLSAQRPNLDEVRQALGRIVETGNRAAEVIRRIRALLKKAPPRNDGVTINDAILEVVALTHGEAVKNGVSLQTQLADDLPLIGGDRVQLQQVVLNLVINAIEAMTGTNGAPRELLISTERAESECVLVAVRDSGPGLAPAALERLFEAFYTTKPSGLGLGLSICRSIIEAHGGRLWASANLPRGAVFQFTVPAHPAEL